MGRQRTKTAILGEELKNRKMGDTELGQGDSLLSGTKEWESIWELVWKRMCS